MIKNITVQHLICIKQFADKDSLDYFHHTDSKISGHLYEFSLNLPHLSIWMRLQNSIDVRYIHFPTGALIQKIRLARNIFYFSTRYLDCWCSLTCVKMDHITDRERFRLTSTMVVCIHSSSHALSSRFSRQWHIPNNSARKMFQI